MIALFGAEKKDVGHKLMYITIQIAIQTQSSMPWFWSWLEFKKKNSTNE